MFFERIILWYLKNKRDLPWRNTKNPYLIWLSEIILQQTRVAQGLPYYNAFAETFPRIEDLANASQDKVLRLWQGLGYYSRGRNLHFTAQYIANDLNGEFPDTYNELLKLKGVGKYTAAAIASFAYKESVPAIDGNVIRVISRIFSISEPVNLPSTLKKISEISESIIIHFPPDTYNQAIMEFGATHCLPKKPKCDTCPVREDCLSFPKQDYKWIPLKNKKTKVIERDIYYLVIVNANRVFLKQRLGADIWHNLYDFPEINTEEKALLIEQLNPSKIKEFKTVTHLLTHRKLNIQFVLIETQLEKIPFKGEWHTFKQVEGLPKPIVIVNFIKQFKFFSFEEF